MTDTPDPTEGQPPAFKRLWCLGTIEAGWEGGPAAAQRAKVFVEAHFDNVFNPTHPRTLGITGVVGPKRNGDAWGSCGQCVDSVREIIEPCVYDPWTLDDIRKLCDIWDRWHLNGMIAGSPRQMEWLRANPLDPEEYRHPKSHYDVVKAKLAAVGLQPDPEYLDRKGQPYSYGSAWLYEELPLDVYEWLTARPDTDIPYPWSRA